MWEVDMGAKRGGGHFKQKVYKAEGGSFAAATNLIKAMKY